MKNIIDELFPETKFQTTPKQQLDKVLEELVETEIEINDIGKLHHSTIGTKQEYELRLKALYEGLDTVAATMGLLRRLNFSSQEILDGIYVVQDKNRKRGYYKTEQLEIWKNI